MLTLNSWSISSSCDSRLALNYALFNHRRLINPVLFCNKRGAIAVPKSRNFRVCCELQLHGETVPEDKRSTDHKILSSLESEIPSGNGIVPSNEWKTVPDIWRTSAEKFGDRIALVDPYHDPPTNMTYKQVSFNIYSIPMELSKQDQFKLLDKELTKWTSECSFQIGPFLVLDEPFTIESGLMTPTMKIRRDKVVSLYKEQIDNLYK